MGSKKAPALIDGLDRRRVQIEGLQARADFYNLLWHNRQTAGEMQRVIDESHRLIKQSRGLIASAKRLSKQGW
jgi:hypothetical protein